MFRRLVASCIVVALTLLPSASSATSGAYFDGTALQTVASQGASAVSYNVQRTSMDIRMRLQVSNWATASGYILFGDAAPASNGYSVSVTTGPAFVFFFKNINGTLGSGSQYSLVCSGLPWTGNSYRWIRLYWQARNASNVSSLTCYTSDDGVSWTSYSNVSLAGYSGGFWINSFPVTLGSSLSIGLTHFVLYNNDLPTPWFDLSASKCPAYALTCTDDQGRVWTLSTTMTASNAQAPTLVLASSGGSGMTTDQFNVIQAGFAVLIFLGGAYLVHSWRK